MTFWGERNNGDGVLLGVPKEVALDSSDDAPADLLKAVFPASGQWEELAGVSVYEGGKLLFAGPVDEQNTAFTPEGTEVELICRSRAALLLDNEAMPQTLRCPSLRVIARLFLEPLGFSEPVGSMEAGMGELTVQKGESCWTVLERFCGDFLGVRPRVGRDGTLFCDGRRPEPAELSGALSATLRMLPCKRISSVCAQNRLGVYETEFSSPEAEGVLRRRYVDVSGGRSPREILEEGERAAVGLELVCEGFADILPGAAVSAGLPDGSRWEGCTLKSVRYRADRNGERTRLILEGGRQECG